MENLFSILIHPTPIAIHLSKLNYHDGRQALQKWRRCSSYCDQGVGLRTQRCCLSCWYNSSGNGPASLAAMFDST